MKTQYPTKNLKTGKYEIWDFAYEENGERFYELHEFYSFNEAIEYWKTINPKIKNENNYGT